jgi:hypothetical protein
MNMPQRTVMVIASGLAIAVVITTVNRLWLSGGAVDGGWFNYAPNSGVIFPATMNQGWIWREALLWLIGIATWAGVAYLIYRRRESD